MEKKLKLLISLVCVLLLSVSGCDDDVTDYDPGKLPAEFNALTGTTEAVTVFTRTTLNNLLRVIWGEGDQIGVFAGEYRNVAYTAEKLVAETAVFEGEKISGDIDKMVAYFPYNTSTVMEESTLHVTLPEIQAYTENSFDEGALPMVGVATTQSVMFKNLCGIARINVKDASINRVKNIKLYVSGDNVVAGEASVDLGSNISAPELVMKEGGSQVLTLDCEDSGIDLSSAPTSGVNFYFVLPPSIYEDVTIMVESMDGEVYLQNIEELVVERSKIIDLPSFIAYSEEVFYGKSNAILRDAPGTYTFDVSPYYTTDSESYSYQFQTSPMQTVASTVELIWQDKQDMITHLALMDDGHSVEFTAAKNGNALVGIYDDEGAILWSFHIWISEVGVVEYPNGYHVLDRNLGATSAEKGNLASWGLYYQWGRKDPFAASDRMEGNTPVAATYYDGNNNPFTFPNVVETAPGVDQAYAIQNPATFINDPAGINNNDWYFGGNSSLWGNPLGFNNPGIENIKKSIYDPCPEGYMVAPADLFTGNGVVGSSSVNFALDTANKGRTLSTDGLDEWYPAARHIKADGTRNLPNDIGRYWLSAPNAGNNFQGMSLSYGPANNVFPGQNQNKLFGFSVRCVRNME